MNRGRLWTVLLVLYITADYLDPTLPGVFFLGSATLFMDSVVVQTTAVMPNKALAAADPPIVERGTRDGAGPVSRPGTEGSLTRRRKFHAHVRQPSAPPSATSSPEDH